MFQGAYVAKHCSYKLPIVGIGNFLANSFLFTEDAAIGRPLIDALDNV